ncbi:MAG: hypothetical protein JWM27_1506 [Gemmatimonadetes bacterium]|nr:hypothetical protein [Gemmatimonadota bacterium]
MRNSRTCSTIALCTLALACTDRTGLVGPGPRPAADPIDRKPAQATLAPEGYPHIASGSDGVAEYGLAYISWIRPVVYWEDAYANASSAMDYYGNHGDQNLSLLVIKDGTALPVVAMSSNDEHFLPDEYHMVTSGLGLRVSGTCGWSATLTAAGKAEIFLFADVKGLTVLSSATRGGTDSRAQPACAPKPCTSVASNDLGSPFGGDYDPYEFASHSPSACDGGAESGNASGTAYKPGDMTGGETVDWRTGIGNGGASACGAAAQVEFMCVEYYVQGEGWKDLGCGYVTTC